jgi:CTP-dependent riboflavin kinase
MHLYQKIYEFAASAGAFEGYVYRRTRTAIDAEALSKWADNLLAAYHDLPADAVAEFQSSCDKTLGRAIRSLLAEFGEEHPVVGKLKRIVRGELPETPDDFQKQKWFQDRFIESMEEKLVITGKIVSGAGQGAYFTQIDWVQQQCNEKLGFKPCPGTLNLELSKRNLPTIESLEKEKGIELISPNPKFCNAKALSVSLGEIRAAIVMPEEKVRIHPQNIIEIIAPLNIKAALNVKDGDYLNLLLKV